MSGSAEAPETVVLSDQTWEHQETRRRLVTRTGSEIVVKQPSTDYRDWCAVYRIGVQLMSNGELWVQVRGGGGTAGYIGLLPAEARVLAEIILAEADRAQAQPQGSGPSAGTSPAGPDRPCSTTTGAPSGEGHPSSQETARDPE